MKEENKRTEDNKKKMREDRERKEYNKKGGYKSNFKNSNKIDLKILKGLVNGEDSDADEFYKIIKHFYFFQLNINN